MQRLISGVLSAVLAVSAFGIVPVSADSHEEKRMLVVFKEDVNEQEIDETVEDAGGEVTETYDEVDVATVEVSPAEVEELLEDPAVAHVEEDIVVTLNVQTNDWGIDTTKIPAAWNSGFTGKGVKVAVIDSGIAPHSDLVVAGGYSAVSYTTSYADDQGHGTHVAGIIAARNNSIGVKGVAYEAQLYAVKSFNQEGAAYLSDLVEGVNWSIANDMDIINLSAGTQSDSSTFRSVIDKAYANGLLVVAAAGNDGTDDAASDTVDYPARYASAIAVGAVDRYSRRASFSSTGPNVEIAAPGVSVLSTVMDNQYAYMSGTSMATPYVSGILALLKQAYPNLTNQELRALLIERVKDLGAAGRDPLYGYGLMQASSFTEPVVTEAENPVTELRLSANTLSGAPGEVKQVKASAVFEDGTVRDVTAETEWSSVDPSVATVADGRVELKGYGSTTLSASFDGKVAFINVTVPEPNPIVRLESSSASITGSPGSTSTVTASAVYKNGTVRNVTSEARWVTGNSSVATVANGRIELQGYGSTTVTATFEGQSVSISVSVPEPKPEPNPVVEVRTNRTSLTGQPGEAVNATATAVYQNGATANVTTQANWTTSNSAVAVVTSGRIELKGYGTAAIKAVYDGQTATIAVNVPQPAPAAPQPEPTSAPEPEEPVTAPQPAPAPSPEPAPAPETTEFEDVSEFYAPAVNYLVQQRITKGVSSTEFGVSQNIKRADAAVWLADELNLNTETAPASGFADVPSRAAGAVNALKAAGIISGKTSTRFGAYDPLTRGEVAIILQRAYGLTGTSGASPFEDVSDRYRAAVNALVANNVTNGVTPTTFGVTQHITRGQLAIFMYRLSEK